MSFELIIVTPYGEAFRENVEGVVLPGSEGEFGVLAEHERFLSPLQIGEVEIRRADGLVYAAVADGFAEVTGERVAVLVESCELAGEIDVARAEMARERSEQGLAELGDEQDLRYREFDTALARARNRLTVGNRAS